MKEKPFEALIFAGTSHQQLVKDIAGCLGVMLGKVAIEAYPDGEIALQIQENVRGRDVFVIQTIALDPNKYLVELLILIDALKRAAAGSITVVMPYFGYCRQDRADKTGVPITAKLVADMLTQAGATQLLTVDLHAGQLQGFFNIPVNDVGAKDVMTAGFKELYGNDICVVAPDIGSVKLARGYARALDVNMAIIDKVRSGPINVDAVTVIGDVEGKDILLADDMCTTGSTLASAAKACREKGAKRVFAAVTHGILVGDAMEKIAKSPIEALMISDTIPIEGRIHHDVKVHVVSIAPLLARAIRCIASREAV